MTCYRSKLLVALTAIACFACEAQAAPDITQAVSQDCRWDYHNFCSEYGIASPLLNYCFRNNGAKLSRACERLDCSGRRLEELCAGPETSRPLTSACFAGAPLPTTGSARRHVRFSAATRVNLRETQLPNLHSERT